MSSNDEELPDAEGEGGRRSTAGVPAPSSSNARASSSASSQNNSAAAVTLIHDAPNWLSVIRNLKSNDIIVLLTPVVFPIDPEPTENIDPFECFGRALSLRHSKIRHVPYTNRNGITSTHVGIIQRATVVILVLSDTSVNEELGSAPQVDAAHVTQALTRDRPLLIVLTCNSQELPQFAETFPTIIQSRDYSKPILELTASVIFGEEAPALPSAPHIFLHTSRPRITQISPVLGPRLWEVEQWNETRDFEVVHHLWTQNMDAKFALTESILKSLLLRPGYARHYVVRAANGQVLGFCATYLSYVDKAGEKLIASLALLLVEKSHVRQGIGLSLHSHALDQLKRTRGVARVQLGSTFPRLLLGPPNDIYVNQPWFFRRGWRMDREVPGQGRTISDMVLYFSSWRHIREPLPVKFRSCQQQDLDEVCSFVEEETVRESNMGWFDQYSRLRNDVNVKDVILAVDDTEIVGAVLTYTAGCGSPIEKDLPWAASVGSDIGGITCICIRPAIRDEIMMPLLDACVEKLALQGMRGMFLDGVSTEHVRYKQIGFQDWAKYQDVWKDI